MTTQPQQPNETPTRKGRFWLWVMFVSLCGLVACSKGLPLWWCALLSGAQSMTAWWLGYTQHELEQEEENEL